MSGKKILIIDDDRDLLIGLTVRLKASGYDVVTAADATSAISRVIVEKPDLIILDIGLPGGDGYIIMERLKSIMHVATIPVIILTAKDPQIHKERTLKAGAVAFLHKPADSDELLASIQNALESYQAFAIATEAKKGRKKILVVDDDRDLLLGLTVRLKASGYDVFIAADAPSAISTAQKEKPDLIILDIGLPGGDGFVVMERLRSPRINITAPVIILTARDPKTHMEQATKAGAVAFLHKPFENNELLSAIRKALEGRA